MATQFSLVILNLLLISLLFSQCLAIKTGGARGLAKNKHSPFDMIKLAQPVIKKIADGSNNQAKNPSGSQPDVTEVGAPQSSGIYTISLGIGTGPQNVTLALDITSDVTWTPCQDRCQTGCLNQTTSLYNPNVSSTFYKFFSDRCLNTTFNQSSVCKQIAPDSCSKDGLLSGLLDFGCVYFTTYDELYSLGNLGSDTITLDSSVPDIVFGCGQFNLGDFGNTSGVLALGRGPLSYISQLQYEQFSYCLSSDQKKDSPVNFGSSATLESGPGQSTPLVTNVNRSSLYYIGLIDIMVGSTPLKIPSSTFELQANGSGGVYLSTSFPVTYLEQTAYDLVKKAIISQMNQPTVNGSSLDLDLCFNNSVTKPTWPLLTLQFAGGANLKLKPVNYVVKDQDTFLECFTVLPSNGFSALGSFIQMDTHFVYDLNKSTISFEPCNVVGASPSSGMSRVPQLVTTILFFLLCLLKFF